MSKMGSVSSEVYYEEVKTQTVYALVSPMEQHVFVGVVPSSRERRRYSDHRDLRQQETEELVSRCNGADVEPVMYRLQGLECTAAEAHLWRLAWIRFFIEAGYESVARQDLTHAALSDEEKVTMRFEAIRHEALDKVLSADAQMFPKARFGRKERKAGELVAITFRVSQEEADAIQSAAREKRVTVPQHCRDVMTNGINIHFNMSMLSSYLAEIQQLKKTIMLTAYTIYKTKKYYPPVLRQIQEAVDTLAAQETRMQEVLTHHIVDVRETIQRAKGEPADPKNDKENCHDY